MEEQAEGDPGKRRSRELHQDVGPSRSGSTKSDSENRPRPASGKGRSELGNGGVRQARLAGWAFEPEDGTSGLSERRSGAPVERKLGEPEGTKPQ